MAGEKIVVADDEADMRELIERLLKLNGFEVKTAENGKEAMDIIVNSKDIDLLITDIQMPEMDGLVLADLTKKHNPKIGIIFMTGYSSIYEEGDVRRVGGDDYISKPFNFEDLLMKIELVIEQMRLLKPKSS